jgi:hypothetical protein
MFCLQAILVIWSRDVPRDIEIQHRDLQNIDPASIKVSAGAFFHQKTAREG